LFKTIKNSSKYIVSLSIVALLSACGSSSNEGANSVPSGDSQLVSAVVVEDVNTATMLQVIQANIDPSATNAFGYKAVKITYNTLGQNDEPVVASGLLVIPTASDAYKAYLASVGTSFSVSMICDNHGTIFTNAEAPSNVEVANGLPDSSVAVLMTGFAGFAAILPDYIGYGDSNDVAHPYILKKASARASLDMIKASIKYMNDNHIVLNYQLFVSGYSEGGYNAMALAQEIEKSFSTSVNLKGVAPMAGPYNVTDLANIEIDATRTMRFPAFLAYLADSYAYYYDDLSLSDITVKDASIVDPLFSGAYDAVPIHVGLGLANGTTDFGFYTHTADELFQTSFINDYQNNLNTPIRARFEENNLDNWTPKSKINLIQCVDDEIIPFSESQNTYDKFLANGVDVTLTGLPTAILTQQVDATHPFVHANCGTTAYGAAVKWFADIRSGAI
jgi:predicted esterase